jgi:hypothetical protein
MRYIAVATAIATIMVASACSDSTTLVEPDSNTAPTASPRAGAIPGRFIVTLRERTDPAGVAREHGVRPDFVYQHALTGFAGKISDAARAGLLRDARVTRVEPDGIATIVTTQSNATCGLDRIDQRSRSLSGTFHYTNTGAGVTVYIIDTGIKTNHTQFGTRASSGYDAVDGTLPAADCNGHGTHVAGTVGGATYGVAKGVRLVAVRVLDCNGSGTWSGVIAGMDWVTAHRNGPSVANMSLGGGASGSVDDAVRRMIASGVSTAVAAGNGNSAGVAQDACKSSPARVSQAMTIGASNKSDRKASWSNYGNCVDWFAPGVGITSAWYSSTTATNTISGTSMASPHTAGVAALYLQSHTGASPQGVRDALFAVATKSVVTSSKTANNHLLFTSY